MSRGRVRKLAVLAIIGGAVAAAIKALRGEPTPVYSNHPSINGGPTLVAAPEAADSPAANAPNPAKAPKAPKPAAPKAAAPKATEPKPAKAPKAVPSAKAVTPVDVAWVASVDGVCPDGYPIKAKVKSGIYHTPGTPTYDRTKPDRCYPSVEAAEADGLRPPKR